MHASCGPAVVSRLCCWLLAAGYCGCWRHRLASPRPKTPRLCLFLLPLRCPSPRLSSASQIRMFSCPPALKSPGRPKIATPSGHVPVHQNSIAVMISGAICALVNPPRPLASRPVPTLTAPPGSEWAKNGTRVVVGCQQQRTLRRTKSCRCRIYAASCPQLPSSPSGNSPVAAPADWSSSVMQPCPAERHDYLYLLSTPPPPMRIRLAYQLRFPGSVCPIIICASVELWKASFDPTFSLGLSLSLARPARSASKTTRLQLGIITNPIPPGTSAFRGRSR
ncbi:hypothetical protein ANO11243_050300 [Dothideomycetidae sp. 11243]|nr:hypothetical protein ANO11243_050300 [fungal sp. No.11243]